LSEEKHKNSALDAVGSDLLSHERETVLSEAPSSHETLKTIDTWRRENKDILDGNYFFPTDTILAVRRKNRSTTDAKVFS
jgi:hypothetical protein